MRLIDADAVIRDLTGMKSNYDAISLDGMIKGLEKAPTIDAVPVKHSFWEEHETSTFGGYDEEGNERWWNRKFFRCERCRKGSAIKQNFCPICGADMREGKDGDGNG